MSHAINYDELAIDYVRHRRVHPGVVRDLIETGHVCSTSRVLEVGCGTGNYIHAFREGIDCECYGVDRSAEMLAQANFASSIKFSRETAEALSFPDEHFDLVFSVDVIHHVGNRGQYSHEALRVLRPGGRICTVTDSEWIIRHREPLAVYFPETIEADLARYPSIAGLRGLKERAGFQQITEAEVEFACQCADISAYRDKAFSCLHLISEDAHRRGIERMEQDLKARPLRGNVRYVLLWGTKTGRKLQGGQLEAST